MCSDTGGGSKTQPRARTSASNCSGVPSNNQRCLLSCIPHPCSASNILAPAGQGAPVMPSKYLDSLATVGNLHETADAIALQTTNAVGSCIKKLMVLAFSFRQRPISTSRHWTGTKITAKGMTPNMMPEKTRAMMTCEIVIGPRVKRQSCTAVKARVHEANEMTPIIQGLSIQRRLGVASTFSVPMDSIVRIARFANNHKNRVLRLGASSPTGIVARPNFTVCPWTSLDKPS